MSDHTTTGRSAQLDQALADLLAHAPEVQATAVVSFDGLPMASALPVGMDEDRVAAMCAALLSLGERAAESFGRGDLTQVYVEGEEGTVCLVSADDEAVLVGVTARGAKIGLVRYELRRAAEAVAAALRTEVVESPVPVLAAVPPIEHASAGGWDELLEGTDPAGVTPIVRSNGHHAAEPAGWTGYQAGGPADPAPWS